LISFFVLFFSILSVIYFSPLSTTVHICYTTELSNDRLLTGQFADELTCGLVNSTTVNFKKITSKATIYSKFSFKQFETVDYSMYHPVCKMASLRLD